MDPEDKNTSWLKTHLNKNKLTRQKVPDSSYSQLSISKEHVWVSRGKRLRSMLHMAVTVTLRETANSRSSDMDMLGRRPMTHRVRPVKSNFICESTYHTYVTQSALHSKNSFQFKHQKSKQRAARPNNKTYSMPRTIKYLQVKADINNQRNKP